MQRSLLVICVFVCSLVCAYLCVHVCVQQNKLKETEDQNKLLQKKVDSVEKWMDAIKAMENLASFSRRKVALRYSYTHTHTKLLCRSLSLGFSSPSPLSLPSLLLFSLSLSFFLYVYRFVIGSLPRHNQVVQVSAMADSQSLDVIVGQPTSASVHVKERHAIQTTAILLLSQLLGVCFVELRMNS